MPKPKETPVTDWFPPNVKPLRERRGPYKVRLPCINATGFAWWSGRSWGSLMNTIEDACKYRSAAGAEQNKQWMGLAVNPNAKERK